MKKGGKRVIAIPSTLAYGEKVGNTESKINVQMNSFLHPGDSKTSTDVHFFTTASVCFILLIDPYVYWAVSGQHPKTSPWLS